jgi:hypothetical protein
VLQAGLPLGKPADQPCVHLDVSLRCCIFTQADRPAVCAGLQPSREMCGDSTEHAMLFLQRLEQATAPWPRA